MRSTATRVLAIVAAAACAAGLSSCRQGRGSAPEISGGDDTAVAGSSTGAPPGGADSTDSAEVRDIEPVTVMMGVVVVLMHLVGSLGPRLPVSGCDLRVLRRFAGGESGAYLSYLAMT